MSRVLRVGTINQGPEMKAADVNVNGVVALVHVIEGDDFDGRGTIIRLAQPVQGYRVGNVISYSGGQWEDGEKVLPVVRRRMHVAGRLAIVKDQIASDLKEALTFDPKKNAEARKLTKKQIIARETAWVKRQMNKR